MLNFIELPANYQFLIELFSNFVVIKKHFTMDSMKLSPNFYITVPSSLTLFDTFINNIFLFFV